MHMYLMYIHTCSSQDLSILSDPKEKGGGPKTAGQNTNAGWYNRFVQTGKSDHETKSNECFGGLHITQSVHNTTSMFSVLHNV